MFNLYDQQEMFDGKIIHPDPKTNIRFWFALHAKPRSEFKAAGQLAQEGINYYLPTIIKHKRWSDRNKKIEEPLIRGYVFIFADESERLRSLELPSIVRCVFDQGKPARIPEWQIDSIKNLLKSKADVIVKDGLVAGARVKIKDGPFKDVIGVVTGQGTERSLVVSIHLLKRSIVAYLPPDCAVEVLKDH